MSRNFQTPKAGEDGAARPPQLGNDVAVNTIALVAAGLAAALHVGFFYLESIDFSSPRTYRRFLVAGDDEARIVRNWAFNQGFYNLFLAAGTAAGIVVWATGHHSPGRALIVMGCGSMLAAALVLIGTDRRMVRPAMIQGTLPLLALALIW